MCCQTAATVTGKLALVAPAGTVTLDGMLTRLGVSVKRLTTAPPFGAGDERNTCPVVEPAPVMSNASVVNALAAGVFEELDIVKELVFDQGLRLPSASAARTRQNQVMAASPVWLLLTEGRKSMKLVGNLESGLNSIS
jgi:hypothetical protein